MPTETCDHGNFVPYEVLNRLPHSQAGTGRHKCAICAYSEGVQRGRQTGDNANEIQDMIKYLTAYLGHYTIKADGTKLNFRSSVEKMTDGVKDEDFQASFPTHVLLEMYRAGELENMFLIPAVVPH